MLWIVFYLVIVVFNFICLHPYILPTVSPIVVGLIPGIGVPLVGSSVGIGVLQKMYPDG
jgi:hypothetical protein